jgi:hypothetical protein
MRARLIGLAAVLLVALAWTGWLDRTAHDALDAAFKRSFATFAIARTLNGAISMLQDADVSVSPVGVGVTVSPGELLDPLNDLLEQFSTLAFAALTALGIQKFALHLSGSLLLNILLTSAVMFWLSLRFWSPGATVRAVSARALVWMIGVRFLVPLFALATALVDRTLLTPEFEAARAALQLSSTAAEAAVAPVPEPQAEGIGEQLSRWWATARAELDVRERVTRIKTVVENAAEPLVMLAVIFLLQAIVLPLAFLALGSHLLRVALAGMVWPQQVKAIATHTS